MLIVNNFLLAYCMCIFVFLEVKKNYKFSYIDKIMQGIKNE